MGHTDPTREQARAIARLRADQAGVVSRAQLADAGLSPHDVRRLLRNRELAPLHPGVYVDHTGDPTWLQRAWGAVLACGPAALAGESALRAVQGPGGRRFDESVITVAVEQGRNLTPLAGVTIVRQRHLDERVAWQLHPPRLRTEEAVLDLAAAARDDVRAIGVVAELCGGGYTTPQRLRDALAGRSRLTRGRWLDGVLQDLAEGTCSVLEHAFQVNVERAHGLPRAERQQPAYLSTGLIYRDATYANSGAPVVVELDGRAFHSSVEQRDRDMDRDLLTALSGKWTLRLGYGQVLGRPCVTADRLAQLLAQHGWTGQPRRCGSACELTLPNAA